MRCKRHPEIDEPCPAPLCVDLREAQHASDLAELRGLVDVWEGMDRETTMNTLIRATKNAIPALRRVVEGGTP